MNPLIRLALCLAATPALGWTEPVKGSAVRSAMLDALRPHAEWQLGAPVEFVVSDIRVQGRAGFLVVLPQRPGGGEIALSATPMVQRDGQEAEYLDGSRIDALLKREGDTWVAVHWAIGATDAWYASEMFCPDYGDVMPESCN